MSPVWYRSAHTVKSPFGKLFGPCSHSFRRQKSDGPESTNFSDGDDDRHHRQSGDGCSDMQRDVWSENLPWVSSRSLWSSHDHPDYTTSRCALAYFHFGYRFIGKNPPNIHVSKHIHTCTCVFFSPPPVTCGRVVGSALWQPLFLYCFCLKIPDMNGGSQSLSLSLPLSHSLPFSIVGWWG